MKKIIVASKNPVKINASREAFKLIFPNQEFEIEGVAADSGVSNQPKGDETYLGALNRVNNLLKDYKADFFVGIEGGIEDVNDEVSVFAWAVVKDVSGKLGKGKSGTFMLPAKVAELINQGKELGEAADLVFHRHNVKQGDGTIGILTRNIIDRTKYYVEAVIYALIPHINQDLY